MENHEKKLPKNAAFTLLELLVVIAILGLLSSVAIAYVQDVRVRARDAEKLQTINEFEKALRLYYEDHQQYPPYSATTPDEWSESLGPCGYNWCQFQTDLQPYLKVPYSLFGGDYLYYLSRSGNNFQSYAMMVQLKHSSNQKLSKDDAGCYFDGVLSSNMYEVGEIPGYCCKYSGLGANWFYELLTGPNLCYGGN